MVEEKEKINKKIVEWIIGAIFGIILTNLGIQEIIKPGQYAGAITIVIAFLVFYFTFYAFQIKNNQKEIEEVKEKINKIREEIEKMKENFKFTDRLNKLEIEVFKK